MNEKITIQFTPEELDYVAKVLAQRPWAEVNQVLMNIQRQVQPPVMPNGHAPEPAPLTQ